MRAVMIAVLCFVFSSTASVAAPLAMAAPGGGQGGMALGLFGVSGTTNITIDHAITPVSRTATSVTYALDPSFLTIRLLTDNNIQDWSISAGSLLTISATELRASGLCAENASWNCGFFFRLDHLDGLPPIDFTSIATIVATSINKVAAAIFTISPLDGTPGYRNLNCGLSCADPYNIGLYAADPLPLAPIAAVPLPATFWLLLAALGAAGGMRRLMNRKVV